MTPWNLADKYKILSAPTVLYYAYAERTSPQNICICVRKHSILSRFGSHRRTKLKIKKTVTCFSVCCVIKNLVPVNSIVRLFILTFLVVTKRTLISPEEEGIALL